MRDKITGKKSTHDTVVGSAYAHATVIAELGDLKNKMIELGIFNGRQLLALSMIYLLRVNQELEYSLSVEFLV